MLPSREIISVAEMLVSIDRIIAAGIAHLNKFANITGILESTRAFAVNAFKGFGTDDYIAKCGRILDNENHFLGAGMKTAHDCTSCC